MIGFNILPGRVANQNTGFHLIKKKPSGLEEDWVKQLSLPITVPQRHKRNRCRAK